jgi:hypothetical protein
MKASCKINYLAEKIYRVGIMESDGHFKAGPGNN